MNCSLKKFDRNAQVNILLVLIPTLFNLVCIVFAIRMKVNSVVLITKYKMKFFKC